MDSEASRAVSDIAVSRALIAQSRRLHVVSRRADVADVVDRMLQPQAASFGAWQAELQLATEEDADRGEISWAPPLLGKMTLLVGRTGFRIAMGLATTVVEIWSSLLRLINRWRRGGWAAAGAPRQWDGNRSGAWPPTCWDTLHATDELRQWSTGYARRRRLRIDDDAAESSTSHHRMAAEAKGEEGNDEAGWPDGTRRPVGGGGHHRGVDLRHWAAATVGRLSRVLSVDSRDSFAAVDDVINTNTIGRRMRWLCRGHGVCCYDLDIVLTSDGHAVVAAPADVGRLFDVVVSGAQEGTQLQPPTLTLRNDIATSEATGKRRREPPSNQAIVDAMSAMSLNQLLAAVAYHAGIVQPLSDAMFEATAGLLTPPAAASISSDSVSPDAAVAQGEDDSAATAMSAVETPKRFRCQRTLRGHAVRSQRRSLSEARRRRNRPKDSPFSFVPGNAEFTARRRPVDDSAFLSMEIKLPRASWNVDALPTHLTRPAGSRHVPHNWTALCRVIIRHAFRDLQLSISQHQSLRLCDLMHEWVTAAANPLQRAFYLAWRQAALAAVSTTCAAMTAAADAGTSSCAGVFPTAPQKASYLPSAYAAYLDWSYLVGRRLRFTFDVRAILAPQAESVPSITSPSDNRPVIARIRRFLLRAAPTGDRLADWIDAVASVATVTILMAANVPPLGWEHQAPLPDLSFFEEHNNPTTSPASVFFDAAVTWFGERSDEAFDMVYRSFLARVARPWRDEDVQRHRQAVRDREGGVRIVASPAFPLRDPCDAFASSLRHAAVPQNGTAAVASAPIAAQQHDDDACHLTGSSTTALLVDVPSLRFLQFCHHTDNGTAKWGHPSSAIEIKRPLRQCWLVDSMTEWIHSRSAAAHCDIAVTNRPLLLLHVVSEDL